MASFEEAAVSIIMEDDETQCMATLLRLVSNESDLVRKTDDKGFTLLHHAVRNSRSEVAAFLLNQGADPNAISHAGMSPLGFCGRGEDDADCRALLMEKGCEISKIQRRSFGKVEDVT